MEITILKDASKSAIKAKNAEKKKFLAIKTFTGSSHSEYPIKKGPD